MKFGCLTIGLFSLFYLNTATECTSATEKIRCMFKRAVSQPVQTAKKCCLIGIKGIIAVYSSFMAVEHGRKCVDQFTLNHKEVIIPFKTGLITSGLALLALECGSSLIDDIQKL